MAIEDVDIILSVKDAVEDVLTDDTLWTAPFTVYGQDAYRDRAKGDEPTRPYAFLIAAREPIETRWLPVVLVDGDVRRVEIQLGSMSKLAEIRIHVIARTQREAMVIAAKLADDARLDNLALYDHATDPDTAAGYTLSEVGWDPKAIPVPEKWAIEGTLRHWVVMENQYIVM